MEPIRTFCGRTHLGLNYSGCGSGGPRVAPSLHLLQGPVTQAQAQDLTRSNPPAPPRSPSIDPCSLLTNWFLWKMPPLAILTQCPQGAESHPEGLPPVPPSGAARVLAPQRPQAVPPASASPFTPPLSLWGHLGPLQGGQGMQEQVGALKQGLWGWEWSGHQEAHLLFSPSPAVSCRPGQVRLRRRGGSVGGGKLPERPGSPFSQAAGDPLIPSVGLAVVTSPGFTGSLSAKLSPFSTDRHPQSLSPSSARRSHPFPEPVPGFTLSHRGSFNPAPLRAHSSTPPLLSSGRHRSFRGWGPLHERVRGLQPNLSSQVRPPPGHWWPPSKFHQVVLLSQLCPCPWGVPAPHLGAPLPDPALHPLLTPRSTITRPGPGQGGPLPPAPDCTPDPRTCSRAPGLTCGAGAESSAPWAGAGGASSRPRSLVAGARAGTEVRAGHAEARAEPGRAPPPPPRPTAPPPLKPQSPVSRAPTPPRPGGARCRRAL